MTESVARRLEALGAHRDVVAYAEAFDDDGARFWAECPRGDWLLAIAIRAGAQREATARAAVAVLALALEHLPDDDALARRALARLGSRTSSDEPEFLAGDAAELDALDRAAAEAPDPAVSLARQAIALCARTLELDGALEDLAIVPALLAQAAALDAGDCAMMAAASYAQRRSAELVRAHLAVPCSISGRAEPST